MTRLILTLTILALLTACGGGDPDPESTCVVEGKEMPSSACR